MREPRRRRALAALAGGLIAAAVVLAPSVSAQTDDDAWAGSELTAPFRNGFATVDTESFPITGTFRKQARPLERIIEVDVRFERADGPSEGTDECLPADPAPFRNPDAADGDARVLSFEVPADASVWPCNGRYRVIAAARSSQSLTPHEIVGELSVAAPPAPVESAEATFDPASGGIAVSWAPLRDPAVDAVGYRVERAGPGDTPFSEVAETGNWALAVTDTPSGSGDYRYRVRAIRSGPDGPVLSPAGDSPVASVTVPGDPDDTTTTTAAPGRGDRPRPRGGAGGGVNVGRATPRLPAPPTTADTGFDERLDYGTGDAPVVEPGEPGEEALAGQGGQSIIRTDDEGGPGLLAPAAGALVLLGWAGHVAYLNRLAKQF